MQTRWNGQFKNASRVLRLNLAYAYLELEQYLGSDRGRVTRTQVHKYRRGLRSSLLNKINVIGKVSQHTPFPLFLLEGVTSSSCCISEQSTKHSVCIASINMLGFSFLLVNLKVKKPKKYWHKIKNSVLAPLPKQSCWFVQVSWETICFCRHPVRASLLL